MLHKLSITIHNTTCIKCVNTTTYTTTFCSYWLSYWVRLVKVSVIHSVISSSSLRPRPQPPLPRLTPPPPSIRPMTRRHCLLTETPVRHQWRSAIQSHHGSRPRQEFLMRFWQNDLAVALSLFPKIWFPRLPEFKHRVSELNQHCGPRAGVLFFL